MTKKILSFAAGLFLATTVVHAEQFNDAPKSEISISYGTEPLYYLGDSFANALGGAIGSAFLGAFGIEGEIANKKNLGVINIDYNYHFCPWFALGINADWSRSQGDIKVTKVIANENGNGSKLVVGNKIGSQKSDYYTVMLNVKFDWYRREHLSMYSRLAGGIMFAHTSESKDQNGNTEAKKVSENTKVFEGQLSFFGIEAGSNHIRGFAEFGFGECGIAQIGCRYRF